MEGYKEVIKDYRKKINEVKKVLVYVERAWEEDKRKKVKALKDIRQANNRADEFKDIVNEQRRVEKGIEKGGNEEEWNRKKHEVGWQKRTLE